MIERIKKLHAEGDGKFRVTVRYMGDKQWHVCELIDVDDVGVAVNAGGETIGIPWTGLAAISFRPTGS
ncbi:MAG: hypothetical protein WA957_00470 [Alteraurantiacibacter sp.]